LLVSFVRSFILVSLLYVCIFCIPHYHLSLFVFSIAPIDGHWGRWSSWSPCDAPCGAGNHNRTRLCDDPPPQNGGKQCVGDSNQTKNCFAKTCGLGQYIFMEALRQVSVECVIECKH